MVCVCVQVEHIKYLAFAWWVMYVFFVVIVVFNMMLAIVLKSCVLRPASHNLVIYVHHYFILLKH